MESPPPHVAMQFLSFPRMGAARLPGDRGGRVVTGSLIVESQLSRSVMKEKIRGKPAERKFLTVETESRSEALTEETVRLPVQKKVTVCNNLLFVQFPLCHETRNFTT